MRLAALGCLLILAGCSSPAEPASAPPAPSSTVARPSASPSTFKVSGELTLGPTHFENFDDVSCAGLGGYDDIRQGTQVRVTDADGTVVALGKLEKGLLVDRNELIDGRDSCTFYFHLPVPTGGDIFGVEVSHRGIVQFKRSEATRIQLTLG